MMPSPCLARRPCRPPAPAPSVFLLAWLALAPSALEASHFRTGGITWRRVTGNTVELTVTQSWRAEAVVPIAIRFGDGSSGAGAAAEVDSGMDLDGAEFVVTRYTVQHTYASEGPFTASMEGCCKVDDLVNASDAGIRVEAIVDLRDGNTGSPLSVLPARVQMVQGEINQVTIPISEPDGDPFTCRLASFAESDIPFAASAGGLSLAITGDCRLEWDTAGTAAGEKYAVQVIVEDIHAGNASRTALEMVIEIAGKVKNPPSCSGSSGPRRVRVGETLTAVFTGMDPDGDALTIDVQGMPEGSTLDPAPSTTLPQPFAATFAWTPAAGDDGSTRSITVTFTDPSGLEASCEVSIRVENCAVLEWDPLRAADCDTLLVEFREADGATLVAARSVPAAHLVGFDAAHAAFLAFHSDPPAGFEVGLVPSGLQVCRPGGDAFRIFVGGNELPPGGLVADCGLSIAGKTLDGDDRDQDGSTDAGDGCPNGSNPLQEDCNLDGEGDACDGPDPCQPSGFCRAVRCDPLSTVDCDELIAELRGADGATVLASGRAGVGGLPGMEAANEVLRALREASPAGLELGSSFSGFRLCRADGAPVRVYLGGVELSPLAAASVCGLRAWLEEPGCADGDQDRVCDAVDNCTATPNPSQLDQDGDGTGDACPLGPSSPPDCSTATASPAVLWPPNHKFALIEVQGVVDPDGDPVRITVTEILQNEPVRGRGIGSGRTCPDGVLVDTDGDDSPDAAGVRAERAWFDWQYGPGRVYAIHFVASDGKGGECAGVVEVCVPWQRHGHARCGEAPPVFSSTSCRHEGNGGEEAVTGSDVFSWEAFQGLTPEPLFLRGDGNWDETIDLSDGIRLLQLQFGVLPDAGDSPAVDCLDAADMNDDGVIDISDPLGIFAHLFLGAFAPPPPYLAVGPDPTPDGLQGCR